MELETTDEHLPSLKRLTRDLVNAAYTLSDREARFLVDAYYIAQEARKRAGNQQRSMPDEPHELITWILSQNETLEKQIKRALVRYTDTKPIGGWLKSQYGIAEVISAGLMAHIDITVCPTVGHIWRFAGLDPSSVWKKRTKRPWNASLKTLTWKIGQSFMKFSNEPPCVYGHVYRQRKEQEVARNDSGRNAETAKQILETRDIGKNTEAYKHYSEGHLPPAHVDARARRFVVKLFLSHMHLVWTFMEFGKLPPDPYPLAIGGHAHFLEPPGIDMVPGMRAAMDGFQRTPHVKESDGQREPLD